MAHRGGVAFSPDGLRLIIQETYEEFTFFRTGHLETVLRLKIPVEEHLVHPVFSSPARWPAAFAAHGEIDLWDIPFLRRRLADTGPDWHAGRSAD